MDSNQNHKLIKTMCVTKAELCEMYGITLPTLRAYIKELGFYKYKKRFTPSEVKRIFEHLGLP